jgi:predicted component of type VI protein secretion system
MAYLTIRIKGEEGYTRAPLDKERSVLGRASASDLPVKHTSISREHCAFVREGDAWFVEDLGSSNGTWLNKAKVNGRAALSERDVVKCGQGRFTFHAGALGAPEVAVDLDLDDDGPAVPRHARAATDPAEAVPCADCGLWLSIAHRQAGDRLRCPRCQREAVVPVLT